MAVLLLSGSLLVVPAEPVMGLDGVPDYPARYSACVGPALEPVGFRDMDGSFAADAANCLAHYGITVGTSPGVFSPGQVVARRQMALFLVRAAGPAGIDVPEPSDQGFADLDVGTATVDAISQAVGLGIMDGTSPTTFDPHGPVTREQMAVMLARFLSLARIGPGGVDIDEFEPDDNHFVDLSSVSRETRLAVRKLYEMGVTQGTSVFNFSPGQEVNRGQMAVFIGRMLAHTTARPAGLTLQVAPVEAPAGSDVSKVEVAIASRGRDHEAQVARRLDVFTSTNPGEAFDEAGRCTGHVSSVGRGQACVIEGGDWETNAFGNLLLELDVGDAGAFRVWVWRGFTGQTYDNDTDAALAVDVRTLNPVAALEVSDDMRSNARLLRFGDTVTFTFRLVDAQGEPVRKAGVKFELEREAYRNDRLFIADTIAKETGPDGSAQFTFRHADPTKDTAGDVGRLDLDVVAGDGLRVIDMTTAGLVAGDGTGRDTVLEWSDEEGVPTTLRLSMPDEYLVASVPAGVGGDARAVLTDQFGSGVTGKTVTFTSSGASVAPPDGDRTTDIRGVATFHFRHLSDSGAVLSITARSGGLEATARQHWAAPIPAGTQASGQVAVTDPANNRAVVVSGTDVWLVEYAARDHFTINGEPVRLLTFKEAVTVGATLTAEIASTPSGADTLTLTTP